MVDRADRDRYTEDIKHEAIRQIDIHAETLFILENEFGFNLDVATDVYGIELLDPLDSSKQLASTWRSLLSEVAKNEGQPLALIRIDKK